jgi:2Fe-2S ferredoxin
MPAKITKNGQLLVATNEESLLELCINNKVSLDHSCGGMATCGTCLIQINSGLEQIEPRNELENEMAQAKSFLTNERLACQLSLSCDFDFSLRKKKV